MQYAPPKRRSTSNILHGVISQKVEIFELFHYWISRMDSIWQCACATDHTMGLQIKFAGHEVNNANAYRPPREMPQGTVKQVLLIPHSIITNIFDWLRAEFNLIWNCWLCYKYWRQKNLMIVLCTALYSALRHMRRMVLLLYFNSFICYSNHMSMGSYAQESKHILNISYKKK